MRVLITGAGGFIGAAVAARAPEGTEVRALLGPPDDPDRLPPGTVVARGDIVDDVARWSSLAQDVDVLLHLAGPASVADSFADPSAFLRAHVLGAATVVQLAADAGISRLVHISSAEVYGAPDRSPVAESAPLRPRSPYGAAKVGAEAVVGAATRTQRLDAVVLRPFSVFGPGMRRSSLFGTIVDQVLAGGDVSLHDPSSIRDHCFVEDLADAVWRAAAAEATGNGTAGSLRTYNVGTGTGIAAGELAAVALGVAGGTGSVTSRSDADRPVAAAIPELVADVEQARRALGWQATTSLADGLRRTLAAVAAGVAPVGHEADVR